MDLPNNDSSQKRKLHILKLIKIAEADGHWHENEKKFMKLVADRIGLSEDEITEVLFYPDDIELQAEFTQEEKVILFYDMLFMMKMDGFVSPEEEDICMSMGRLLDLPDPLIKESIEVMRSYQKTPIPNDMLMSILQKYIQ